MDDALDAAELTADHHRPSFASVEATDEDPDHDAPIVAHISALSHAGDAKNESSVRATQHAELESKN